MIADGIPTSAPLPSFSPNAPMLVNQEVREKGIAFEDTDFKQKKDGDEE